ncbi:Vegetative incompatibility protein HET-E-1, partial [Exophiala xenobiotica]
MRLLKIADRGKLSFTDDLTTDIPPYAILSHTWGTDQEEVTFKDFIDRRAKNKEGYTKIQFCADQARKDGLRHFWIDT